MAALLLKTASNDVDNRLTLVMVTSKRARQLALGSKETTSTLENDKPTVMALRRN
ncbi:UNVERIFIED_CONTAM: hypothetical protein GTU68_014878 [Idotea baltica]|nr:hypothetical protein [Idotea baltica]